MFQYFIALLKTFPAHQFRAMWQNSQMRECIQNLDPKHVVCVHDYSENYTCQHQDQIQSLYFSQTQVSVHVTVLHRHAVPDLDGETSTESDPVIVTEHLYVISPDVKHDSHSVHKCRELVAGYLKEIGYEVEVMHEWTDGCSAQYKSRHCMGDVSKSVRDFGFLTIRNFFETSHAKGPQDGAGANLKHQCDMAVIRRQVVIQNAKDMHEFAIANLKDPSFSQYQSHNVKLKRRVFFYVDEVDRNRKDRLFNEVKGNREIHSIVGEPDGVTLKTRTISCYCENCLKKNYQDCWNKEYVPPWSSVTITQERSYGDERITRSAFLDYNSRIVDLVTSNSIVAVASADRGEDYYLLKVTGDGPEVRNGPITDEWGAKYPAGAEVILGNFFIRKERRKDNHRYELHDKQAAVYATTVRYICQEMEEENGFYVLPTREHEDILGALNGF